MKTIFFICFYMSLSCMLAGQDITSIPNQDFEFWTSYANYSDPDDWDTPNEELIAIPFFGTTVVTRSNDHQSGIYSARLESKEIFLVGDIPGFITLGDLTIDISTLSFSITGGSPIYDMPTHLKGYYKFFPKGGDSCAIGIGLFKTYNDSAYQIAIGQFSTRDTVADWTPFSAWIDYDSIVQPDTMNVIALSSAQEDLTPGTVLFVDDLYLDYTVGLNPEDPATGIDIYHDRQTNRILVFLKFDQPEETTFNLYHITGQIVATIPPEYIQEGKQVIPYGNLPQGIYILEVIHQGKRYVKKYYL